MIQLESITQTFAGRDGEIAPFRDLSLDVAEGEICFVTGPSGAGKTTLLLAAGGMRRPTAGEIRIDGQSVFSSAFNRRSLGFVFQTLQLIPYLEALENVVIARDPKSGIKAAESKRRALDLLEELGLGARLRHRPSSLSIGERQRVALARALLNRPKAILADEPTGNLDEANSRLVFDTLERYRDEGGAVLVATHATRFLGDGVRQLALGS